MAVETGFEVKFGQLVDSTINEKLPSLVPYRVGFQVIDKTEEGDRAVGVAAFVINKVWVYIPVFFLKGDIKGTNLLYIKQKNRFVPATDNWIGTLSEKGATLLGSSKDPSSDDRNFSSPESTSTLPFSKTAAAFGSNSIIDEAEWEGMCKAYIDQTLPVDMAHNILGLGKTASQAFINTVLHDTDFANAMFTHYTVDDAEKLMKGLVEKTAFARLPTKGSVTIITDMQSKEATELDDNEKSLLLRNGVYVQDTRTNFSKVFEDQVDTSVLQTPTSSGIYDVAFADGSFKTYIVLLPNIIEERPSTYRQSNSNVSRPIALIDVGSPEKYYRKKGHEVFVRPAKEVTDKFVKGLQGGVKASLRSLRDIPTFTTLLFVASPDNVIETKLIDRQTSGDGSLIVTLSNTSGNGTKEMSLNSTAGRMYVEFLDKPGQLRIVGDHLFVPESTRIFIRHNYREEDNLALGTPESIARGVRKQAGLERIELHASPDTLQVKTAHGTTPLLTRTEGLRYLTEGMGIFAGQAQIMHKEAQRHGGRRSYLIKYAAPFDIAAYGTSQLPFMGGPRAREDKPAQTTFSRKRPTSGAGPTDSSGRPMLPKDVIQEATKAAQTGVKEVFDTAVLRGLVDIADLSELRKDYIRDLLVGLDKLGRMLFLVYWHREDFEEKYGEEDLTKLEDTLQQVFESLGDLILFLQEKTAYNPDVPESLMGSLSEEVGSAG